MQFKQRSLINSCFLGAISALMIAPALANTEQPSFEQCKDRFHQRAQKQNYSEDILKIIDNLTPIERVISLDKNQPEFAQSFAQYVKKRVSDYHVNHGRKMLKTHKTLLSDLQKQYGVAPQYIVSFWGLETVFGRHKGKMSTLNSLATLACDQRRSSYFTDELFDLFYLIENKTVDVDQLQGSWAGAMGHMQFMPSALKKYAIDGDKDNKINVWQSEVDALTSAANYLSQIGWQRGERWGREVKLPPEFDFASFEFDKKYPLSKFAQAGVQTAQHKALPQSSMQAELVLPNGHNGHAFLVYNNFDVTMKWNLSKNYALAVGILADKLIGAPGVGSVAQAQPLPFSRTKMEQLQAKLNDMGFKSGKPDGVWGPNSRKAIRAFQLENELVADGFPNQEVFQALQL
ncbi:lytic murein transglycosylase [Thalassotalea marina]|uniref:Lytic transglycosylase n=1 Tax=Thalassotalea marina TaxID=1673741 RepID=A0A919EM27_9GAMM|nr:lytic murein transglycosylase [Thalassotalea marina]GHF93638.1 lytic transglycosylase [Thalassotalea marina]